MDLDARIDRLDDALARLAEAQARTEERLGRVEDALARLAEAQARTEERLGRVEVALERLAEAQARTEAELARLVGWQRGEAGRREGERYEREIVRRAPALFNGGTGGGADDRSVREWLTERLGPVLADVLDREEDPFLADLLWWKGAQVALVEISLQVNGEDVARATRRAETLRKAGADALAVVIGEEWATPEVRERAGARRVEWKVGPDLSAGFLAFRQRGPG